MLCSMTSNPEDGAQTRSLSPPTAQSKSSHLEPLLNTQLRPQKWSQSRWKTVQAGFLACVNNDTPQLGLVPVAPTALTANERDKTGFRSHAHSFEAGIGRGSSRRSSPPLGLKACIPSNPESCFHSKHCQRAQTCQRKLFVT